MADNALSCSKIGCKSLTVLDRGMTHANLLQEKVGLSPETRNTCSDNSPSLTQTHHCIIYAPQTPIISGGDKECSLPGCCLHNPVKALSTQHSTAQWLELPYQGPSLKWNNTYVLVQSLKRNVIYPSAVLQQRQVLFLFFPVCIWCSMIHACTCYDMMFIWA